MIFSAAAGFLTLAAGQENSGGNSVAPYTETGGYTRCFTAQEITDLGITPADREGNGLRIANQNWPSAVTYAELMRLLMIEALGFEAEKMPWINAQGSAMWTEYMVHNDWADLFMETWMYAKADLNDYSLKQKIVKNLGNGGYAGQSGYYVPNYLTDAAFKTANSISGPFFPKYYETLTDASLVPSMMQNYTDFFVNHSAYFETQEGHSLTTLPFATFTPSQCAGGANCVTFLMVMESWDKGTIQAQITNLGLKAKAEFWGYGAVVDFIPKLISEHVPFISYWYQPDSLIAAHVPNDMSRYILPTATDYCWRDASGNLDGTGSTVDCDYSKNELLNIISVKKFDEKVFEDLVAMLQLSTIAGYQISAMLNLGAASTATNTAKDAACQWARANTATWATWIVNTYTQKPQLMVEESISGVFWAVFGLFMVLAMTLYGIFLYARNQPQIRVISVPFMSMAWFGCVLLAVSGAFHVAPPTSMATCHARWWLPVTSCVLIMGPLLAKSYRTYRIFEVDSKKITNKKVTNTDVLLWVFFMYIPAVILLAINTGVTGAIGLVTTTDVQTWTTQIDCPVHDALHTALLMICFLYVFALTYVSFISRNLPDDFNEITHMMYLSLLLLLIGGFGIAIWGFASATPTNRAAIIMFALLVCAFAVELTLFGPKVYLIVSGQAKRSLDTHSSVGSVVSGVNSVIPEA